MPSVSVFASLSKSATIDASKTPLYSPDLLRYIYRHNAVLMQWQEARYDYDH